jgi:site-specific DNA-methyltransferase (adenine-specific)/adenine-specific DNA-methyltransferase
MARPVAYDLTDAEKRDLIQLIQQGKNLPEKYRFVLFEDKREVELVWNGKTREVCTTILPFQTLEHIDEPRREAPEIQGSLFDPRGRQIKGWTNKLIWGDNKLILSSLKSGALRRQIEEAGGLKLIYIDPPFDVGADFSMDIEIGGETFHKEPNLLEQIAYRDTWGRGADSFISMIYERLILMRDLLAEDGSIYVHLDYRMLHHVRLAMGEVFGSERFLNQIIWKRTSAHSSAKRYGPIHDAMLFFTKSDTPTWNQVFQKYDESYLDQFYTHRESDGRRWRRSDLTGAGVRHGATGEAWKGINVSSKGRHWFVPPAELDRLDLLGKIHWPAKDGGMPMLKRYLDEQHGVPLQDVWDDINPIRCDLRLPFRHGHLSGIERGEGY